MTTLKQICKNLTWLLKELQQDIEPTTIDSTIPKTTHTPTTQPKPPTPINKLQYKIDIEDELKNLITQILKHTKPPTHLATKPLTTWTTWLANNTHEIQNHPEPQTIEQGLRTIEKELWQNHQREPATDKQTWLTIQQTINHIHNKTGQTLTKKQIQNWRQRGYIRAYHSLDGTTKYNQTDIENKLGIDN